jgi:hypothetical protein
MTMTTAEAILESALSRVDMAAAEAMVRPRGKLRRFRCRTCRVNWQVYGVGGSCAECIRSGRVQLCRICDNGYVGSGFPCNNCGARGGGMLHESESFSPAAGMTREQACWVQNVLNQSEGEALATDGLYGPLSRAAVLRFQQKSGFQVDGIVGPVTEAGLIQAGLNRSAMASLVPITGVMDAVTRQEVVRFQQGHGLAADGIVGPRTRAAMVTAMGGRCPVFPPPRPVIPTPVPPPPVGCDQARFDALKSQCTSQAINAGVSCLTAFGVGIADAAKIVAPMVTIAVATGEIPVLDVITAGIAAFAASFLTTTQILQAGSCLFNVIRNVIACREQARVATRC